MSSVECFLLLPEDLCEVSFRCFHMGSTLPCSAKPGPYSSCSSGSVVIGTEPFVSKYEGEGKFATDEQRADPRFPKTCTACGRAFGEHDAWYIDRERLYRMPDGQLTTTRKAPPGAMWTSDHMIESRDPKPAPNTLWCGPDGLCLYVMLPDGTPWCVDGFATNAPYDRRGWSRTGEIPKVTARPSIATSQYHGYLTCGRLEAC